MGEMQMPDGGTMSMAWTLMPGQTWLSAAGSFLGMWVLCVGSIVIAVWSATTTERATRRAY
jgi:hypothetical protein